MSITVKSFSSLKAALSEQRRQATKAYFEASDRVAALAVMAATGRDPSSGQFISRDARAQAREGLLRSKARRLGRNSVVV